MVEFVFNERNFGDITLYDWKPDVECMKWCSSIIENEQLQTNMMPYAINLVLIALTFLFFKMGDFKKVKTMLYIIVAVNLLGVILI